MIAPTPEEHAKFIKGLREVANFFEANPHLKLPPQRSFTVYGVFGPDLATFARAFGKCDKKTDDFSFQLVHTLPSGMKIDTYTSRENVCKRVLVGTEEVPAHTIPAVPEKFIEASTRNVYEWECPESILGMADETTVEGEEVLIGTVEDDMPNPTIHRLTLPSITVTIRGGRTELSPGWPLDQILEIEQVQREQMERNQRRKEYLK